MGSPTSFFYRDFRVVENSSVSYTSAKKLHVNDSDEFTRNDPSKVPDCVCRPRERIKN